MSGVSSAFVTPSPLSSDRLATTGFITTLSRFFRLAQFGGVHLQPITGFS